MINGLLWLVLCVCGSSDLTDGKDQTKVVLGKISSHIKINTALTK